jgi:hypothetical protein
LETNYQCKYCDLWFTGFKQNWKNVTTTDGKKMLVWVILPPNFDATKSIQHFYIAKEDHKAPWRNSILSVGIFS